MKKVMVRCCLFACILSCHNNPEQQTHIFALMGQSNMVGGGGVDPIERKINDRIFYLDLTNKLQVVKNNLYSEESIYLNSIGSDIQCPKTYSLGISFADEMISQYDENDLVVLVPCARGLSSIDEQVDGGYDQFGIFHERGLYDICRERLRTNLDENAQIDGILYFQGENDFKDPVHWKEKMRELVKKSEDDFPNATFIFAQLGNNTAWDENKISIWNVFKKEQYHFSIENKIDMIYTDDLKLYDGIHLSSESLKIVGHRFAEIMKRYKQNYQ